MPALAVAMALLPGPGAAWVQIRTSLERGIQLYRERNFREAETVLRQAIAQEPGSIRARLYLARTLVESDRVPQALAELETLLRTHAGSPEAQFEAGRLLQELAGARFARIQQLAPDSLETHELLGRHHEAQGRLKEALSEFQVVLKRSPNRAGINFLAGNIHWKQHDYDAAVPLFEAELRLNPNHTMANHRLGNILLYQHQSREAVPYLERAVQAEPEFLDARRDLGKALSELGRNQEAFRQLSVVAERRPEDDKVHYYLATVAKALGDTNRAASELAIHRRILAKRLQAAERK